MSHMKQHVEATIFAASKVYGTTARISRDFSDTDTPKTLHYSFGRSMSE